MRKHLLAAVAALAVSSPAYAGNLSVEVQGGYDAPTFSGTAGTVDGISYGATLAYELALDETIFLGAEVSVDDSTSKECSGAATLADPRVCVALGRDLGAGVRFGMDVAKNTSLYGMVGYSNLRVSATGDDGTGPVGGSASVDGLKVGISLRQYFAGNAYGKVEYRYSNYEGGLERHQGLVGVGYQF